MNFRFCLFAALASVALTAAAKIEICEPLEGAIVSQLYPVQAKLVSESREEREKYFDGGENAKALKEAKSRPKPVSLKWRGGKPPYLVEIRRLPDGKVFFTGKTGKNEIAVDSLEIAREWEWTVSGGGESGRGTFKTEDRAPRLVKISRVVNIRDIGGWKGLNGRRIKQGLLFRSGGLNANAPIEYYSVAEITKMHAEGKLEKMGEVGRNHARQLDRGEKLRESDMRLVKRSCFAPGDAKLTEKERQRVLDLYGFKTDLDLRSAQEVYGMTGSPLGPSVDWVNVSLVGGYGRFANKDFFEEKRKIFKPVFDRKSYPIVFHCIAGADRTGTIAFMIGALLGVEEDDLALDYLVTGLAAGVTDAKHKAWFDGMIRNFRNLPGKTSAEKMNGVFLDMGFTQKEIDDFREFMLEP